MTLAVFAKTQKGKDEVETKSGGLSLLVRRVLIFIDGKRTVNDLKALPKLDDLPGILQKLESEGYITQTNAAPAMPTASTPAKAAPPAPSAAPPVSASPFRPLPAAVDPVKLQMARNFMANTLNTFVGTFGASGLINRLDRCQDHAELRALFDDWYQAIASSRQGKREADNLRQKLLEVI